MRKHRIEIRGLCVLQKVKDWGEGIEGENTEGEGIRWDGARVRSEMVPVELFRPDRAGR